MMPKTPMTDDDIKSLVLAEVEQASSYASTASADRRDALNTYLGRPMGDERPGRSQVVTRESLDVIEWIMPSLLRLFTTSEKMVRVDPVEASDIAAAEAATDYINLIWEKDNEGFINLHNWFKSALLYRLGVLKVYWSPEDHTETFTYQGLTQGQLMLLAEDKSLEIMAAEQIPAADEMLFNVSFRRTVTRGKVKVETVPPEEFLYRPGMKSILEDGVGHRRRVPISDLIEMGFDPEIVNGLPAGDADDDPHGERAHRWEDEGTLEEDALRDDAMREVVVTEWYTRIDRDADGYAEKVMVTLAGGEILDIQEVDDNPFAVLSPVLMPHKLEGLSLIDLTRDLQVIKSTLQRQMLDSLYLANNPRTWAVDNQVNLDDLMTNRPGGIVRVKQPGMVGEMNTQFVAGAAFPMLEYLDQTLEGRTGVSRMMQGLDADALNRGGAAQTATGVAAMQSAAQSRVELVARVYAETGVKRAFGLILRNAIKYQDYARMVRLNGKFVEIDPRGWSQNLDLTIAVGLGTGNQAEQMGFLGQILTAQKEALGAGGLGLVKPKNIFNTLAKMIELAGLKTVAPYFLDPEAQQEQPQEPPKPDPQLEMIKMQQEIEQGKLQLAREKMIREDDRARDELDAEVSLKSAEISAKYGTAVDIATIRAMVDRDREMMKQQTAMMPQQPQMPPQMPQGQPY
jgi:hypothetical protein